MRLVQYSNDGLATRSMDDVALHSATRSLNLPKCAYIRRVTFSEIIILAKVPFILILVSTTAHNYIRNYERQKN